MKTELRVCVCVPGNIEDCIYVNSVAALINTISQSVLRAPAETRPQRAAGGQWDIRHYEANLTLRLDVSSTGIV